jgi:hypothetical protein
MHMGLRCEIVDFVGVDITDEFNEIGTICEIPVMEKEVFMRIVWILVQMINSFGIEQR